MSTDDDTIDFGKFFRRKKDEVKTEQQSPVQSYYTSSQTPSQHTSHAPSISHGHPSHPSHSPHSSSHSSDETISFDSVKQFFKKLKSGLSEPSSDDHVDFDFKKYSRWIIPALIIGAAFILAFYIRAQPYDLPATDTWAEDSVNRYYRAQFEQQINQQFPNLPAENKDVLIATELQNFIEENGDVVQQQTDATSQQYKEQFRDPNGETYLLGIDPYYYYRQAQNILTFGHVGTELRDGMPFDTFKPAPEGSFIEPNLHPYLVVFMYKVLNIFSNMSLVRAFFYVGPFVAALSVIPAFFIARRASGYVGGFFAAIFVAVNFFFVNRSAGETSDTDSYNVLFPLLIAWTFTAALYQKDWKKHIALTIVTGFLIAFYSFAWTGWWFVLYLIAATIAIRILYGIISDSVRDKKLVYWSDSFKKNLVHLGILILSVVIFTPLFVGFREIERLLLRPFQFIDLKSVAADKIFPNVLTTVAELNPASLDSVVNQLGGYLLVTLAIIGILYTLKREGMGLIELISFTFLGSAIGIGLVGYSQDKTGILVFAVLLLIMALTAFYYLLKDGFPEWDVTYLALFGLWLGVTIWSTTRGVRFTLLIVPALVVGVGLFCGILYRNLSSSISDGLNVPARITKTVIFLLLLLVLIYPTNHVAEGFSVGERSVPSMNDAWYDALAHIKTNSSENTIITSWWDFGHWFKAIADRPVTFDGGSQNRPQAHWVGKLLLTPDEKVSFGLLRMLDCSANGGFDAVDAVIGNIDRSVDIVNEVVVRNKDEAGLYLRGFGFTEEQIVNVLKNTHCEQPPEAYVIASNDMIGKSGVWGHFGAWDFTRASMVFETQNLPRQQAVNVLTSRFNLTPTEAEQTYREIQTEDINRWIAPWPGYLNSGQNCATDNTTIVCDIRAQDTRFTLQVDRATMNASIPTTQGTRYPNSLVYVENGGLVEKEFDDDRVGLSIALIPQDDSFEALVADPLQVRSMFTQMYFYEGQTLKCFELFDVRREITGGLIYVYKVNWDCVI